MIINNIAKECQTQINHRSKEVCNTQIQFNSLQTLRLKIKLQSGEILEIKIPLLLVWDLVTLVPQFLGQRITIQLAIIFLAALNRSCLEDLKHLTLLIQEPTPHNSNNLIKLLPPKQNRASLIFHQLEVSDGELPQLKIRLLRPKVLIIHRLIQLHRGFPILVLLNNPRPKIILLHKVRLLVSKAQVFLEDQVTFQDLILPRQLKNKNLRLLCFQIP